MSLQELIHKVRKNLEVCLTADAQGRPGEVHESLVDIQGLILGFLIVPPTPKEEPVVNEEQQAKPGHSEPATAKEEPVSEYEKSRKAGECMPDETPEAAVDTEEKPEELGDNQKPETDSTDG